MKIPLSLIFSTPLALPSRWQFPRGESALMLVAVKMGYITGRKLVIVRYLDMEKKYDAESLKAG